MGLIWLSLCPAARTHAWMEPAVAGPRAQPAQLLPLAQGDDEMEIGHIEIPASDPRRSMVFYRDVLGFTVEVDQDDDLIWMVSGDVEVLLRSGFETAPARDLAGHNIVLYTDDLPSATERLIANGVSFTTRSNCLHFTDPDGHWLQLVDPTENHRRETG